MSERDRILGSLRGIAIGDAVGKQTETLSHDEVVRWYPDGIRGFEGSPGEVIPRYAGNRKHEWRIGETTDDTEWTIAVARAILGDGDVRHASVGRELLTCRKCIHPGIKSYWEFHQAGDPTRIAIEHEGCGVAVRVAPVGIFYKSHRFEQIVAAAREASISTHGGPLALAGAAATAAAVSAAIDGADARDIIGSAARAADRAESVRTGSSSTQFAAALRSMHEDLSGWSDLRPATVAGNYFPDSPLTIVPLAIALATVMQSTKDAILLAASVGGDSDSVASIAGAILGARHPETVDEDWYRIVERINDHDLVTLGDQLSALRS